MRTENDIRELKFALKFANVRSLRPMFSLGVITRSKFFIEKTPKAYKSDMNLLIFLDLSYNPCKNFKCYSLQVQNVQIFLIFTYNHGKNFLILPITQAARVYFVSAGSCTPPPPPRMQLADFHNVLDYSSTPNLYDSQKATTE